MMPNSIDFSLACDINNMKAACKQLAVMLCWCMQEEQSPRQATTEMCGFITIVIGTFLLHSTKDMDITLASLNAATKSALDRSGSFSSSSLAELQMQRLPLTSNALGSPTPVGHRTANSDRL